MRRRVDPGPLDDGPDRGRGEIIRADRGEGAAVAADRGPDGLDDPGVAERSMEVAAHAPDRMGRSAWPTAAVGDAAASPSGMIAP